ncbi:MAG: phytanoyl-CoA dioxygenase family protein [Rhodospirillales bacterium]|nr:phytanoyl-CoA dioxygenase family protein [Rhodospirillales bacterium]
MRELSKEDLEQHRLNLDIYGYTRVPNYMPQDVVASALKRVNDLYDDNTDALVEGRPERDQLDRVVYNLQNKDKFFIDLLSETAVKGIVLPKLNDPYYRFLPADVPNYILSYYNARSSGLELDLHIDSYIPSPGDHTWVMQAVFVLNDMTEENGCTVVVPGSHLSGRYTERKLQDLKPVHAKAGDLVFWDSRLWHGTQANKAMKPRWALIATLTQWWVKQTMDIPRGLTEEIYQSLSDEQKALMGFCSIPPSDEVGRNNTKCGYDFLKPSVKDYFQ